MVGKPSQAARSRSRRSIGLIGIGALLPLVLSGCSLEEAFHLGWPRTQPTDQSEMMMDLWIGSVIAAVAVGVLVWGLTFWCVVRYRKKDDSLPVQTKYNLPAEITFTGIPFVLIAVLFFYTVVVQDEVNRMEEDPDATVSVTAFKWNWEFGYDRENDAGEQITTTGNSNYIPVVLIPNDSRVEFVQTSPDVIHSFWVPDLLFKRDVIPGEDQENAWQADFHTEGTYVGRCAELCGAYHSMMNFEMRVVSPEEFDEYLDLRADGLSSPDALESMGLEPEATTTEPFDTRPDSGQASGDGGN